jgi:hypothetical protein
MPGSGVWRPETGRPYVEGATASPALGAAAPHPALGAGDTVPAAGPGLGAATPPLPEPAGQGLPDLPRRVRQESLVDQLRNGAPLSAPPPDDLPARSPEETRSTMAAMQHGWERGRSVFDPSPDDQGRPSDGI